MAPRRIPGAALAALSLALTPTVAAQDPPDVDAVLWHAKLLETRGEVGAAEKVLRDALAATPAESRPELVRALATLLRRQGREEEALAVEGRTEQPSAAPREDPLRQLILQLDDGLANKNRKVDDAMQQLRDLGSIAVPHVLAALPQFGPFGLRNALDLLDLGDPTVQAALIQQMEAGDTEVTQAVAQRLERRPSPVAVPLARKLLDAGPQAQSSGLQVLLRHAPDEPDVQRGAAELAATLPPRELEQVAWVLREVQRPWARSLLERLREHEQPGVRAAAWASWIMNLGEGEEDMALAALQPGTPVDLGTLALTVAPQRRTWARLAARMLPAMADRDQTGSMVDVLQNTEWWRAPDEAGPALLAIPHRDGSVLTAKRTALFRLVERGRSTPPACDADLVAYVTALDRDSARQALLQLLGDSSEERVLAVLAKLPARLREAFAYEAGQNEKPWPRVIAPLLDDPNPHMVTAALGRDWTGAPPEIVTKLVEIANRGDDNLAPNLLAAFTRSRDLPPTVGLPLLLTGQASAAFEVLVARDPRAVLDFLRTVPHIPDAIGGLLVDLLGRHGGPGDVPLALRLAREHDFLVNHDYGGDELAAFLGRQGRGNLDVVALARVPSRSLTNVVWNRCVGAAASAASGVQAAEFAAALALAPELHISVAGELLDRIARFATGEHIDVLTTFVEDRLRRPRQHGPRDEQETRLLGTSWTKLLARAVEMLRHTGDPRAVSVLRRVSSIDPDESEGKPEDDLWPLLDSAADAALQVAGPARHSLLAEFLTTDQPHLVRAALRAPETAASAELRASARDGLLRLADRLQGIDDYFSQLPSEERLAVATAVLESEGYARAAPGVARAALTVVGDRKDPALVPRLARGASHPDWNVRGTAAAQLGRTFAKEAAPALLELLKDDVHAVRDAAQKSLDQIASYLESRAQWENRLK